MELFFKFMWEGRVGHNVKQLVRLLSTFSRVNNINNGQTDGQTKQ